MNGSGARGGAGRGRGSGAGTCGGGGDGAVKSGGAGGDSGGVIVRSNLALGCRACTLCNTISTSAPRPACTRFVSVTCIVAPSAWLPPPSRRLASDSPCTSVHTTAQPVASASSTSHSASCPSTVMLVVSMSTEYRTTTAKAKGGKGGSGGEGGDGGSQGSGDHGGSCRCCDGGRDGFVGGSGVGDDAGEGSRGWEGGGEGWDGEAMLVQLPLLSMQIRLFCPCATGPPDAWSESSPMQSCSLQDTSAASTADPPAA